MCKKRVGFGELQQMMYLIVLFFNQGLFFNHDRNNVMPELVGKSLLGQVRAVDAITESWLHTGVGLKELTMPGV